VTAFRTPSNAMTDCIESCTACAHLCLETLAWCQAKGGAYADPKLLALLALCADICTTSARAMIGGSEAHVFLCHACAQVCLRCADSCALLSTEAQLRTCATACANAARCCADMARAPESEMEARARRAS
jgi:hypothetical protein